MSQFEGPQNILRAQIFVNGNYCSITVASKFAGPAGPHSVNVEGPQAILQAIGPRARLFLTPVYVIDEGVILSNRLLMYRAFQLLTSGKTEKQ